jgi:hypothetical protein
MQSKTFNVIAIIFAFAALVHSIVNGKQLAVQQEQAGYERQMLELTASHGRVDAEVAKAKIIEAGAMLTVAEDLDGMLKLQLIQAIHSASTRPSEPENKVLPQSWASK